MIIAQLSDPHLRADGAGGSELARAVAHLRRLPAPPDAVLLTGDVADTGAPDEYRLALDLLAPLACPVHAVPGNHDARAAFRAAFGERGAPEAGGREAYTVEDGPVRLVALDSLVEGRGGGELGAAQLAWLDARLAEGPGRPTLLFVHHPPFRAGVPALDDLGLDDADAFGDVVARHPQVALVAAGHVHAPMFRAWRGALACAAGSTKHHLFPDLARPAGWAARSEAPSVLVHAWSPEAGLVTHLSRVGEDGPTEVLHDGERWMG